MAVMLTMPPKVKRTVTALGCGRPRDLLNCVWCGLKQPYFRDTGRQVG